MSSSAWQRFLWPRFSRAYLARVLCVAALAFLFFKFLCAPMRINGASMEPTFHDDGFTFCWKPAWREPRAGDVVMLRLAGDSVMLLKRIVAVAGETVEFRGGKLFVDGKRRAEPYIKSGCDWALEPRTVEAGKVYVVGDNRGMGIDGHMFGQVERKRIVGRPVKAVVVVLALLAVALATAKLLAPESDEAKVRKLFKRFAAIVDKSPGESSIAMALKTEGLKDMLAASCSVDIPACGFNGDFTPEEAYSLAVKFRMAFESLSLDFHDLGVEFPGPDSAVAEFTARISGARRGERGVSETRELRAKLVKQDGQWRFRDCEAVEVLRK